MLWAGSLKEKGCRGEGTGDAIEVGVVIDAKILVLVKER